MILEMNLVVTQGIHFALGIEKGFYLFLLFIHTDVFISLA